MRSSSTRSVVVLLSILLNIHLFGVQAERKLKLHKLEKFKEDTRFVETNLSFVEVEENVVKVNGELKVIYQVDDHFEIDVEVNRSEERDGEYKSVFYVDKTGVCDFMKTYYKDFFYDRLKEYSNAPDPSTCPLPEGAHYHLDDYPLDVEMLKTLLKPGHYRIELKAMLDHLFYPLIYKAELEVFE